MRIAILLSSLIFISFTSYAGQSGLCEDLAKFTCSPGKQDDGTGLAQKNSQDGNAAAEEFNAKRAFVEKKIRTLLEDPDNAYLRKLGLGAAGLTDAPQCNSEDAAEIKKCKDDLTEGMVSLAKKKLTGQNIPSLYVATNYLEEKTLVLENDQFAKVLGEIEQQINGQFDYQEQEKLIKEELFPKVKKQIVSKISSLPIDEKKKQFMIDKIKGISYGGNSCDEMGAGLNKMFVANAFFVPTKQTFKVCKGLLSKNISEFHLIFVIAHELSHSIDPCSIAIGPTADAVKYPNTSEMEKMDDEYPIQGLLGCLRTSTSVAARPATAPNAYYSGGAVGAPGTGGGYGAYNVPSQAGVSSQQYTYCNSGDQTGEAVSDWFGVEILTDLIEQKYPNLKKEQWQKGYSNVFRPLCSEEAENNPYAAYAQGAHPHTGDRVNSILLVNPKIRAKMGCEKPNSKKIYCDASNPAQLAQVKEKAKADLQMNPNVMGPIPGGGGINSPDGSNDNQNQGGAR